MKLPDLQSIKRRTITGIVLAAFLGFTLVIAVSYLPNWKSPNLNGTGCTQSFIPSSSSVWTTYKYDTAGTGFVENASLKLGAFQGSQVWHNTAAGLGNNLISFDGRIFVPNNFLNALNASTGVILWNASIGVGPYPILSTDGRSILLVSNLGGLQEWSPFCADEIENLTQVGANGEVTILNGTAYVTSGPAFGNFSNVFSLQAIDLQNSKSIWNYSLLSSQFYGSPTTDGRNVLIPINNNTLLSINPTTGRLQWKHDFDSNITISPALYNGATFVATSNGFVCALNSTTGTTIWSRNLNTSITIESSPSVAYSTVYIGTQDGVFALGAKNGRIIWHYPTSDSEYSASTIFDGYLAVSDGNGELSVLNASSGAPIWKFPGLGAGLLSEPIFAYGLLIADGTNGVFAFD